MSFWESIPITIAMLGVSSVIVCTMTYRIARTIARQRRAELVLRERIAVIRQRPALITRSGKATS